MNDTKVEVIFGHDCNVSTAFVTHADYRALEEERARFERLADANYRMYQSSQEELASLRARVGELVEADHAYSEATNYWGQKPGGDKERIASVMAAAERKREAMDALL